MKNRLFETIEVKTLPKNLFDMSHEKKLTCNMGELIPVMLAEALPGEKWKGTTEHMIKSAPLNSPIMHRCDVYFHTFAVPIRLLYDSYKDYFTGGESGTANPTFPTIALNDTNKAQFYNGTLADYLGIPNPGTGTVTQAVNINALPFRAYQLIYNEYYRDQTLNTAVALTKNTTCDSTEQAAITTLRMRSWGKDYFTTALTNTQRGTEVSLPITNTVNYLSQSLVKTSGGTNANANTGTGTTNVAGQYSVNKSADTDTGIAGRLENISSVVSNITVIALRRAKALQEWLEKNAIAGSRYIEHLLVHWGVMSDDARMNRPEYLGGAKCPLTISEVIKMDDAGDPLGTLAGNILSYGSEAKFEYYAKEHCYILTIMSVLPRTSYYQGIPRMFQKADRFDWGWPLLANIGEQAIYNKELYYDPANATNDNVFGYAPRYAEYKWLPDTIHGEFRNTLKHWTLVREFSSLPSLNATFVTSNPSNRVWAVVDTTDKLYVQIYHNIKKLSPLPIYGTPSF